MLYLEMALLCLIQAQNSCDVQVVLNYLLWCMCLGMVEKGDDQYNFAHGLKLAFLNRGICVAT